jgi:hypothetical protein
MPFVVTDTATGYCKRWGSIDCSTDPGFDPGTETNTEVPSLALLQTLSRYEVKVDGGALVEMSQAEKDAVEVAILPAYKLEKYKLFDVRTGELILQGFEFPPSSGYVFSLSDAGQFNLIGAYAAKDNPSMDYPIKWPTRDDDYEYSIPDATVLENFYLVAMGTVRYWRDTGTVLKEAVRVATTRAAVDAVVDNR